MMVRTRAVKAMLTRCHWAIRASWWRHWQHISRKVFHNGGEGKLMEQARIHTSNKTLNTRSHSCCPMLSLTVGGANSVSFMVSRKRSSASHVSCVISEDASAADWIVLNTRWQNTAWRLTKSVTAHAKKSKKLIISGRPITNK